MRTGLKLSLATLACLGIARPEHAMLRGASLLTDDPATLIALEDRGLSFKQVVSPRARETITKTITDDIAELTRGAPSDSPRRPFNPAWLTRGSFELVCVVNRIDRRVFDPSGCGEVRLVYRLALKNRRRPVTRLPMTVNVRIPQPKPAGGDCSDVARRWNAQPDLALLVRDLPSPAKLEINYQSVHVPATQRDMDDNAEYVLRAFDFEPGGALAVGRLFNTPRADLDAAERAKLVSWITSHVTEIDDGSAVVPDELLATRIVSVSPRGLVHASNRPFSRLIGDPHAALGAVSYAGRALVHTPELLVRRLDEATCAGCHQSRGVAGFHLLGEERDARATFNALAVGHSPHLGMELDWRARDLASVAMNARSPVRPFAGHPDGEYGADCGLSPGLAAWTCRSGLVCRDLNHAPWGVCAPKEGSVPGHACEDVDVTPDARALGAIVTAHAADATCPAASSPDPQGPFCAPNWLGFTGGMCSEQCSELGEISRGTICAPLPAAGYEADCFLGREPIESCLERHYARARVALCNAHAPCRDDYGCARVPGAPPGTGACVPPYFIFQARVDGPLLDR